MQLTNVTEHPLYIECDDVRVTRGIQVENVHQRLVTGGRALHILKGISFNVAKGEWVALTGPSGSGKSTLLGILAGIDRPSEGSVKIEGNEISSQAEKRLARVRNEMIGIVFQSFNLIPTMTALENVEAPLFIHPQWRDAHKLAQEMLKQVGLGDRAGHMPYQLSGGEQQRVAIARALVTGPRLLLADEPTGNLDSVTSKQVLTLLQQLRSRLGLTIVMVTHDATVAAYADRTLHIIDGMLADPIPSQPGQVPA